MKCVHLLIFFPLCFGSMLWGQHTLTLTGLLPISQEQQSNVNAALYHDGIIFLANQVGVELFLYNRVVATYPYAQVTGGSQNNRNDRVELLPNGNSLTVRDAFGEGEIDYRNARSNNRKNGSKATKPGAVRADTQGYLAEGDVLKDRSGKTITRFDSPITALQYNFFEKERDVLLVGTRSHGLFRYEVRSGKRTALQFFSPSGTSVRHISCLEYLRDCDAVVIGTVGDGAYLWSQRREQVFRTGGRPASGDDGQRTHIWSFAPAGEAHFLAGNDMGEVRCFHTEDRREVSRLQLPGTGSDEEQVRCLGSVPGQPGLYLAGTKSGKLFRFVLRAKQFGSAQRIESEMGAIHTMYADTLGQRLLIGAHSGVWSWKNGQLSQLKRDIGPVTFFVKNPDGRLFCGGDTAIHWLGGSGQWRRVKGLPNGAVLCNLLFLSGGKSEVLLFTKGNFIQKGVLQQDSFVRTHTYGETNGFAYRSRVYSDLIYPMSTVYGGFEAEGQVWVSTNFGLLLLDPSAPVQQHVARFYSSTALGLTTGEFNTNAMLRLNSRQLLFGSRRGWVLLDDSLARAENKRQRQLQTQIWRMQNVSQVDTVGSLFFSRQQFRRVDTTHVDTLRLDYKGIHYLLVVPDYAMMSTPVRSLIGSTGDTLTVASGRLLPLTQLEGIFNRSDWYDQIKGRGLLWDEFRLRVVGYKGEYRIFQENPKNKVNLLIGLAVLLSAILLWLYRSRKKQIEQIKQEQIRQQAKMEQEQVRLRNRQLEMEQERRQFFIDLGKELAVAQDYEAIHLAVNQRMKEAEHILSSTKMSVLVHEEGTQRLRTVAHGDNHPRPGEPDDFGHISHMEYDLNDPLDRQRPAIYLWNNRHQMDCLIANNAPEDFYRGGERPEPKLGQFSNSFIFQLIKVGKEPVGIISIQSQRTNAYPPEEAEKLRELLEIMGYFMVISLSLAKAMRERAVQVETVGVFNKIVEKRMSQHIAKNFVEKIGDRYPEAYATANAFKQFISQIYTAPPLHYGNREVEAIMEYRALSEFLYDKKIHLRVVNSANINAYKLPAFLLLNAVNNSFKHTDRDEVNVTIEGQLSKDFWMLSVTDDGPGLDRQKLAARRQQGSSTHLWDEYFDIIEKTTGHSITTEYASPVDGLRGTTVRYCFPVALLESIFEKM